MLAALNDFSIDKIANIINQIYNSGDISEDLTQSNFITLAKKPGANNCDLQ